MSGVDEKRDVKGGQVNVFCKIELQNLLVNTMKNTSTGTLHLYLEACSAATEIENLVECRHPLAGEAAIEPRTSVEPLKLGKRKVADKAGSFIGPAQIVVVMNDQFAVTSQVDIKLNAVGPFIHRTLERRQRVFRSTLDVASMRENKRFGQTVSDLSAGPSRLTTAIT